MIVPRGGQLLFPADRTPILSVLTQTPQSICSNPPALGPAPQPHAFLLRHKCSQPEACHDRQAALPALFGVALQALVAPLRSATVDVRMSVSAALAIPIADFYLACRSVRFALLVMLLLSSWTLPSRTCIPSPPSAARFWGRGSGFVIKSTGFT